ncbi:MAG: hypothetical protein BroJett038_12430 [Chloroflexota bacterium]|nr:MAG: hypothetical protein BroJett038_12430 [Chloroflexota bacterium]
MKRYKKARFTDQLPATPCTPEMKKAVIAFASKNNVSLSEVQRLALSLFFGEDNSISSADFSNPISVKGEQ